MDDQMTGHKKPLVGFEETDSLGMEAIGSIREGKERGGISEDERAIRARR